MSSSTPPASDSIVLPVSSSSSSLVYVSYDGKDITDALIDRCAKLFSENYGIWGENPTAAKAPKHGTRVRMTGRRLRNECVSAQENTVLAVCYRASPGSSPDNLELVGHVFATLWDYEGGRVGWITQLVVNAQDRRKYIATSLLQTLKRSTLFRDVTAVGLVSSHPAACHALSKYINTSVRYVDLTFCKANARAILEHCPVPYIKNMQLRGSLFQIDYEPGTVSCAFTHFYVDHKEPSEVLSAYKATGPWILGELPEGHEFLVIVPTKNIPRSPKGAIA